MALAQSTNTQGGSVKRDKAIANVVAEKQRVAEKQFMDKYRYSGELGGLKIKEGKIDPTQDLSGFNVEYYEDGVTPKKILGSKTKYLADKYGNQRTYKDYYGKEWDFYQDGSISQFRNKYAYKDSKGKAGRTSYYSYQVADKERYNFADDDGIQTAYNKYEPKRSGKDDWSNENVYTLNYLDGQKKKEQERLWSNRNQNWYEIKTKDFETGIMKIDKNFSSYAPKKTPTQKQVTSSRVLYEDVVGPSGFVVGQKPVQKINTYKDGSIDYTDLKTNKKSVLQQIGAGKKITRASEVVIPEFGIYDYKTQKTLSKSDIKALRTNPNKWMVPGVNLNVQAVEPKTETPKYTTYERSTYAPIARPIIPKVENFNFNVPGQQGQTNQDNSGKTGSIPAMWGMQKRWNVPIGGQNIGNRIKDYAGAFKTKLNTKKNFLDGKI